MGTRIELTIRYDNNNTSKTINHTGKYTGKYTANKETIARNKPEKVMVHQQNNQEHRYIKTR